MMSEEREEMKYKQLKDYEWVKITGKQHKIKCCDCGLVHLLEFKKAPVAMMATRDNRATGQVRRKLKKGRE
jgi:hypothetical protein